MSYFIERTIQQIYEVLTKKKTYEQRLIPFSQINSATMTERGSLGWRVVAMNEHYVIMEREI